MKWINIYKDENGRFISNDDFSSYKQAYEERDSLSTYVETVAIVRQSHPEQGEQGELYRTVLDSELRLMTDWIDQIGNSNDATTRGAAKIRIGGAMKRLLDYPSPPPEGQDEIKRLRTACDQFKELRKLFIKGSPLTNMMDKIIIENNL